jgi:hypothetical protein
MITYFRGFRLLIYGRDVLSRRLKLRMFGRNERYRLRMLFLIPPQSGPSCYFWDGARQGRSGKTG